jgi:hypothetical protein
MANMQSNVSTSADIHLIKTKVSQLVRHAALTRIGDHTRHQGFELLELNQSFRPGQVLGNWMSIILVTGDALRVTLKLHFSLRDAKGLSLEVYGAKDPSEISDTQAIDFIKELSNLLAGYLIQAFEAIKIPMGISLPLCTRGFYEVFADYSETEQPLIRCSDIWRLVFESFSIDSTVMIEISDSAALCELADYEPGVEHSDDASEFDFL